STDIILVFKTREVVDSISNGKLTLGANASIAAGPVGRSTAAATDIVFQAEVLSYSRSRGLFAGVALEGSGVTMDRKANAAFYSDPSITPEGIFESSPNIAPAVANTFVQLLTAQTLRLPTAPGMQAADGSEAPAGVAPRPTESKVKTFGMPDPGEEEDLASNEDADSRYP
ncbi:MAG: lipid-binding SYLF domain-containing protein, partial [Pseudomonadota bacterium]